MYDPSDFHDTNSIDTKNNRPGLLLCEGINDHEYQIVDKTQILHLNGITSFELTLECEVEDCSWKGKPIVSVGDLPESPDEVDDLLYDVYRWFHDHTDDLRSPSGDEIEYLATFTLITGDEDNHSLLRSRVALFIAAHYGYHDGRKNQGLQQKDEVLRTAKQLTIDYLRHLEPEQDEILRQYEFVV